jgi:hypothetical protein
MEPKVKVQCLENSVLNFSALPPPKSDMKDFKIPPSAKKPTKKMKYSVPYIGGEVHAEGSVVRLVDTLGNKVKVDGTVSIDSCSPMVGSIPMGNVPVLGSRNFALENKSVDNPYTENGGSSKPCQATSLKPSANLSNPFEDTSSKADSWTNSDITLSQQGIFLAEAASQGPLRNLAKGEKGFYWNAFIKKPKGTFVFSSNGDSKIVSKTQAPFFKSAFMPPASLPRWFDKKDVLQIKRLDELILNDPSKPMSYQPQDNRRVQRGFFSDRGTVYASDWALDRGAVAILAKGFESKVGEGALFPNIHYLGTA